MLVFVTPARTGLNATRVRILSASATAGAFEGQITAIGASTIMVADDGVSLTAIGGDETAAEADDDQEIEGDVESAEDQAEASEDQAEASEDQAEASEDQAETTNDQAEANDDRADTDEGERRRRRLETGPSGNRERHAGPLARSERRALRRHLRTCPNCRSSVLLGGGLGALVPLPLVALVRQLASSLEGVGAPAAKTGAVLATAAVAGSFPLAADVIRSPDAVPPAKAISHRAHATSPRKSRTEHPRPAAAEQPIASSPAPAALVRVRRPPAEPRENGERRSFASEEDPPGLAEAPDSSESSVREPEDVATPPAESDAPAAADSTTAEDDSVPASSDDTGDAPSSESEASEDSSD